MSMDNFDQLSSLLAPILNDPEAMAGIAEAAAQLGLGGMLGGMTPTESSDADDPDRPDDDRSRSASLPDPAAVAASAGLGELGDMLGKVMPLISGSGGKAQDDSARLLSALRPFLHGERAKRLEDAERILKLLNVMSALRQQGIF